MDKITVKLQGLYSYTLWPIILIGVIVAAPLIYAIIKAIINWLIERKKNKKKPVEKPVEEASKPVITASADQIKGKYLKILDSILEGKKAGDITNRVAHQELSVAIRNFVKEMTGINIQNCTLAEIDKKKVPQVYTIIEQCYIPEFATDEVSESVDAVELIEKTKKVIEKWS